MNNEKKLKIFGIIGYLIVIPILMIASIGSSEGSGMGIAFIIMVIAILLTSYYLMLSKSLKGYLYKLIFYAIFTQIIVLIQYKDFNYSDESYFSLGLVIVTVVLSAIAYGIKKLIQKFKGNK
ncbi:MAG: hypothetical protein KJ674_04515 [Nanoarchaeota archaeon]|nr:hypothetical protein [Nanoarchaeota archaeon]